MKFEVFHPKLKRSTLIQGWAPWEPQAKRQLSNSPIPNVFRPVLERFFPYIQLIMLMEEIRRSPVGMVVYPIIYQSFLDSEPIWTTGSHCMSTGGLWIGRDCINHRGQIPRVSGRLKVSTTDYLGTQMLDVWNIHLSSFFRS